ncbi:hypothetical protein AB0E62_39515, partial [Streptomyces sp. NPDC038707]|uniref:hypothetical protein n=1 Tax=Streptomyces sp. NPDC038707 TaxID=3154329 RepID=UPI0033C95F80
MSRGQRVRRRGQAARSLTLTLRFAGGTTWERTSTPRSDYLRTGETWTDHSQMSSITVNGKTYAGQYGS